MATSKNPREPRAVKKLIKEAEERIAKTAKRPGVDAQLHVEATLWDRIRRRRPGRGER